MVCYLCVDFILIHDYSFIIVKKSKRSVTRSDKHESHEGLVLIASLIARHYVKNHLNHISQKKPGQNRDEITNTQENQNIDDTEVQ
jgi:hypothetical protein